ncbi:hypothetical protein WG628_16225 [Stenotrophomonas maltophilia]
MTLLDGSAQPAQHVLPLLALTAVLAACGHKEPPAPPYEANPAPTEAYEVVVSVQDAPSDIYVSSASVTYKITNEDCLPPIRNFEGVRYEPARHSLKIPMQRISAGYFKGIYFADGMLERSYYGRSECRWSVQFVGATLRTPASKDYTYFDVSTYPDASSETRYALKDIRPWKDDGEIYPARDWSQWMFDKEVPTANRDDFFSFTISTRRRNDAQ